jgi:hypothetical protein
LPARGGTGRRHYGSRTTRLSPSASAICGPEVGKL